MKRYSTLSAASKAEVQRLFLLAVGYQDTINGSPNPETKAQFFARLQDEWPVKVAVEYRGQTLVQAADATRLADSDLT